MIIIKAILIRATKKQEADCSKGVFDTEVKKKNHLLVSSCHRTALINVLQKKKRHSQTKMWIPPRLSHAMTVWI